MTPALEPEVVVEFHFRCFCGETIVAPAKTVTCQKCGRNLKIRRVKGHRQRWNLVALGGSRNGWRWRKNVVESVAARRFYVPCACGATITTTKKRATCAACGETIALRRAIRPDPSGVVVEYDLDCCFCAAPIVTTQKTVTCGNCSRVLKIVRVGTHRVYWKTVPYSGDQDDLEESARNLRNQFAIDFLLGAVLCVCCLAQCVYELAN